MTRAVSYTDRIPPHEGDRSRSWSECEQDGLNRCSESLPQFCEDDTYDTYSSYLHERDDVSLDGFNYDGYATC